MIFFLFFLLPYNFTVSFMLLSLYINQHIEYDILLVGSPTCHYIPNCVDGWLGMAVWPATHRPIRPHGLVQCPVGHPEGPRQEGHIRLTLLQIQ